MSLNSVLGNVPRVSSMWSLAAFVVASLLGYLNTRKRKPSPIVWVIVAAVVLITVVPIMGTLYVEATIGDLYRIRTTIVEQGGLPVEDAKVWSSVGGEPKRVSGGWEFDVPKRSVPASRTVTLFAVSNEDISLNGEKSVNLGEDPNPNATIALARHDTAKVRGAVTDARGRLLAGVFVCVVGHNDEGIYTKNDGGFVLEAHAADGKSVELHAEKSGYAAVDQWQPAGDVPASLILTRK